MSSGGTRNSKVEVRSPSVEAAATVRVDSEKRVVRV
jgi:hypothetical protein